MSITEVVGPYPQKGLMASHLVFGNRAHQKYPQTQTLHHTHGRYDGFWFSCAYNFTFQ